MQTWAGQGACHTANRLADPAESLAVQALGTVLQLVGNVIMLGGLLWAWHKASGRLAQWRDAIGNRLTQLRDAVTQLLRNIQTVRPVGIPSAEAFGNLTVTPQVDAELELIRAGTVEDRLKWLENRHYTVLNQLTQQKSKLRAAIDATIADELEAFQTNANTVQLRDIYPALFGLLVSIAGYICQLIG